jgi:phospholipid/cholesterol/gamma-HCH transport system ATP-binding protein
VVRLTGLHKRFGNLIVLDGLDLNLRGGETTVILGESGSGKSVLLQHIVCLLRPDKGEVYFHDERLDTLPERKLAKIRPRFGFLFQLGALFDSMTAGDNVAFPLRTHTNLSEGVIQKMVREKLAMVGLEQVAHKWPAQLSGGQKKRVALARAIALNPEVILYDEPTTGLDPPRADEINELIVKLKQELSVTGVVVTHDMASAQKVADRIVMLYKGKFIFDGTWDTICKSDDPRIAGFVEGRCSADVLESLHTGTPSA